MKLDLTYDELRDLIDCLQDSINAERDSLHDPESLLSGLRGDSILGQILAAMLLGLVWLG